MYEQKMELPGQAKCALIRENFSQHKRSLWHLCQFKRRNSGIVGIKIKDNAFISFFLRLAFFHLCDIVRIFFEVHFAKPCKAIIQTIVHFITYKAFIVDALNYFCF